MVATSIATLSPVEPGTTASPDAVAFESRGAVLVIGDGADIAAAVTRVAQHHRTAAVAPGIDAVRWPSRVTAVGVRVAALRGHLGAFRAELRLPEGMKDIGAASSNRDGLFDLVLDLGRKPLWPAELAPLGYFAPEDDAAALDAALVAMQKLVGSFTKPRYFSYQPDWCAHGSSGLTGCTQCLSVCAASAITSAGDRIRVDPYLCQGCATCTLACPTGALSFRTPTRDSLRQQMVDALGQSSVSKPVLVVHGSAQTAAVAEAIGQANASLLAVDPLQAFGDELWLDAFALGASAVVLVDDGSGLLATRALIETRVKQTTELLRASDRVGSRLALVALPDLAAWLAALPPRTDAGAAPAGAPHAIKQLPAAKRPAVLDALGRMQTSACAPSPVTLPAGSSFGEVRVERSLCTLCFACVNLCPTGALASHNGPTPQLRFQEDACIQCGLCERGCPEKAVVLHPRYRTQPSALGDSRVLAEDSLQPCAACGTPFISRKLLASSLERLNGHQVMASGGRARLMMCPSCRQAGTLEV